MFPCVKEKFFEKFQLALIYIYSYMSMTLQQVLNKEYFSLVGPISRQYLKYKAVSRIFLLWCEQTWSCIFTTY